MYEENTEEGGGLYLIISYFQNKKKFLIVFSKKVIEMKYVNLLQLRRYTFNSPRNVMLVFECRITCNVLRHCHHDQNI